MARVTVEGDQDSFEFDIEDPEGNLTDEERKFWLLDAAQAAVRVEQTKYADPVNPEQPRRQD